MFRVQQQYQSGDTSRVEGWDNFTNKNLGGRSISFHLYNRGCTLSHSNDGMVSNSPRQWEGYHILTGGTSWSEQRQEQAMVATRLGRSHEHRTRPNIRIASCSSPLCSCFTLVPLSGTRPLTLGPAGFSHRPGFDLNVSLGDASLEHRSQSRTPG